MKFINFVFTFAILISCQVDVCTYWHLTAAQKKAIGMQIWQNEASQKYDLLVFWNQNEQFPSLGICHFIWFPPRCSVPYAQTFPALLDFLKNKGVRLPAWLIKARRTGAPWKNRADFLKAENDVQVKELKKLLFNTVDLQVEFVIQRLQKAIQGIYQHATPWKKQRIVHFFSLMCGTPQGLYALIDYLNFKGDGTNPVESYNGKQWGLLQVFEAMPATIQPRFVVAEFVKAAKKVLETRVVCAPRNKSHEKQWLLGWKNRIETYLTFNPDRFKNNSWIDHESLLGYTQ